MKARASSVELVHLVPDNPKPIRPGPKKIISVGQTTSRSCANTNLPEPHLPPLPSSRPYCKCPGICPLPQTRFHNEGHQGRQGHQRRRLRQHAPARQPRSAARVLECRALDAAGLGGCREEIQHRADAEGDGCRCSGSVRNHSSPYNLSRPAFKVEGTSRSQES